MTGSLGSGSSLLLTPLIVPSENAVYLAKSRHCLPKYGSVYGSSGGHVHCVGGCRSRQPVGSGAPTEKPSRDYKPEGDGARSAPADQTVSSFEPSAGPDRRSAVLHRCVKTNSQRRGGSRA